MSLAVRATDRIHVSTDVYDGPLDLLLYLAEKDGIELASLPLARITREYLEWIDRMRELDLDVAAEYLLMAAILCELKSRELLPPRLRPAPDPEEPEDPRQALIQRLLEYRRFREAAGFLGGRPLLGRDVFAREPLPVEFGEGPIIPGVDIYGLLDAWHAALRRRRPPPAHEVHGDRVSWAESVQGVLEALDDGEPHDLDELWAALPDRAHRLVCFLAVLELVRASMVEIHQSVPYGAVTLRGLVRAATANVGAIPEAS
jgi:segregation and condensation protein A